MRRLKTFLTVLILTLFIGVQAWAATLIMYPKFKGLDSSGAPLVGGLLYTYKAGTVTPKATYTTRAATTPNANPVVLDANGEATVYGTGSYKFVLKTAAGVTVWTMDNIRGNNEIDFTTVADYDDDFDAAITGIGATPTTLYVDSDSTMSTGVTVPATCKVILQKGGSIDMAGNALTFNGSVTSYGGTIEDDATLTINAAFNAGREQVFTNSSTSNVVFGANSVAKVFPEWWGIDGTDDQVQIISAINSITGRGEGTVSLTSGDYAWDDDVGYIDLTDTTGIKIQGEGYGTVITAPGDITNNRVMYFTNATGLEVCNFRGVTSAAANFFNFVKAEDSTKVKIHNLYLFNNSASVTAYDKLGIIIVKTQHAEIYSNYLEGFQIEASHSIDDAKIYSNTSITGQNLGIVCIVSDTSGNYLRNIEISNNYIYYPNTHAIAVVKDTAGNGDDQVIEKINVHDNHIIVEDSSNTPILMTNATNTAAYFKVHDNIIENGFPRIYYPGGTGWATSITDVDFSNNIIINPGTDGYLGLYDKPIERWKIVGNQILSESLANYTALKPDQPKDCIIKDNIMQNFAYGLVFAQVSRGGNIIVNNKEIDVTNIDGVFNTYYDGDISYGNNFLGAGVDNTAVSTSGTGEDDLSSFTMPANWMGTKAGIKIMADGYISGTNDAKTIKFYFGTKTLTIVSAAAGDATDWRFNAEIYNSSAIYQFISWIAVESDGTVLSGHDTASIDTTAAVEIKLTGECANASDTITQQMYKVSRDD